jgi:ribonucleoside-diphosphate reductase alpha chain
MNRIIDAQIETGTPYILYKDSANQKSNQRHLGVISRPTCAPRSSSTGSEEVAVCNLASLCLHSL